MEALLFGLVVGISLGLTGGGGSIFAVPLLVYGLGLNLRTAVALSLAVVGLTALYGAILQARHGTVRWLAGAILGLGGVLSAPLGAWVGHMLPERMGLVLFSLIMVVVGWRMLAGGAGEIFVPWISCRRAPGKSSQFHLSCGFKLLVAGALTGILAGIFGVGGGFLLVPALLIVARLDMAEALGSSLVGIFLISTSGFAANASFVHAGDLLIGAWFLAGAALGMTAGAAVKRFLPPQRLRQVFAISVFLVAAYVAGRALLG